MPLNVLVVGAGPGGVSAAVQLHRLGACVHWWDRTGAVGGLLVNAHRVENWPGMPVGESGRDCCRRLQEHALFFGLQPITREMADFRETPKAVLVKDREGREESFDALVLAVGTVPVSWEWAQASSQVVYEYARLPAGVRRLLVVGGGEAACDGALQAAESGIEVVLAVRSDGLKARGILARRVLDHPHIRKMFSAPVQEVREQDGILLCRLPEGITEVADAVLFCGGRISALHRPGFSGNRDLRFSNRVRVVGDARRGSLGQGVMAASDGLEAAMSILDEFASRG